MSYRRDVNVGGRLAMLVSPGAPVNDFDADETPDRPNIAARWVDDDTPVYPAPPAPQARYVAPVDLYIERPELGPGVRTLVLAKYEIRPDDLGRELRSAATGRRVRPKRA